MSRLINWRVNGAARKATYSISIVRVLQMFILSYLVQTKLLLGNILESIISPPRVLRGHITLHANQEVTMPLRLTLEHTQNFNKIAS